MIPPGTGEMTETEIRSEVGKVSHLLQGAPGTFGGGVTGSSIITAVGWRAYIHS